MKKVRFLAAVLAFSGACSASAQTTISALPLATTPSGTEIIPVVQGNVTKRATAAQIANTANNIASGANLNTPGAVTLTNGVGLPLTSGVTGTLPMANAPIGTSGHAIPALDGANTWSGVQSGPLGAFPQAKQSCINILLYGGDPSDTSDNTSALSAAMAANTSSTVKCVYFPTGKYKFTSQQSFSLPASTASYTFTGDGHDVTLLDFSGGTSGLSFTFNNVNNSLHLRDFSVLGGAYSSSTVGIRVNQASTVANPAYTPISDFTNVTVRGRDGYGVSNGFGTGIAVVQASNFNFTNAYVSGPGDSNITSSTCLSLSGSTTNVAVVFNLMGSTLNSCGTGLYYGPEVQGVSVSQSNFTGDYTGIYTPPAVNGLAQLSVVASQFNTYVTAINLQTNPTDVQIAGNMIIANTTVGTSTGINIALGSTYTITGNTISSLGGGGTTGNGVIVASYASASGLIANNQFNSLTYGVVLQSGSQNVTVGPNSFSNVTTPVSDSGTNNAISPLTKVAQSGTEKAITVRDPQSGSDITMGSIINGTVIPARTTSYNNPALAGGLFGISDGMSLTNQIETYTLSGTRSSAWIGRTIIVNDGATSAASGPATASYGLSIYAQRPNWNTSAITGEVDPVNIVVRQANGDSAGILSNILTRNGFGATLESYTGMADSTGAPTKAINVQLGVANSRDNTAYGLVVQSALGTGLNAGVRIAQASGTSFSNYLEMVNPSGSTVAYFRGADGAYIGGSLVPATSLGANIGAPTNVYAASYIRNMVLDMQVYSSLPTCNSGANGTAAYISDAASPITAWHQQVTAGGGSNKALLFCNGSTWNAISY